MLDKAFAGFRQRFGGGRRFIREPQPCFNKGSTTDVKIPEWLTQFYRSTAGKEMGLQNYFLGGLTPQGKIVPNDGDPDPFKRDPFKPDKDDKAPAGDLISSRTLGTGFGGSKTTPGGNPIDPVTGKILPGGLGPLDRGADISKTLPAGTFGPLGVGDAADAAIAKVIPPKEAGDPSAGYDLSQLLGYNPEVTPELSPYQQLVGKYIPEVAMDPNAETIAGQLALGGIGSAERTPGVTAEDPTIKALRDVYQGSTKELLKNEATMGGYNRSSALNDVLAKNWMAQLAPALEAQMGRGERAIERGQRARETAIGQQTGAAGARTNRLLSALGLGTEQGALERGVETERAAKAQAEKLRLAALAEQSVMGPMGLLPSSIGSKTGKAK